MPPLHLCRLCGDKAGSNPKCVACRTYAGSLALSAKQRRASVMEDMENAAKWAPANRRFRVLTPGGRSIGR